MPPRVLKSLCPHGLGLPQPRCISIPCSLGYSLLLLDSVHRHYGLRRARCVREHSCGTSCKDRAPKRLHAHKWYDCQSQVVEEIFKLRGTKFLPFMKFRSRSPLVRGLAHTMWYRNRDLEAHRVKELSVSILSSLSLPIITCNCFYSRQELG